MGLIGAIEWILNGKYFEYFKHFGWSCNNRAYIELQEQKLKNTCAIRMLVS